MVDWTILSPTFLTAVVEWAGAAVTVLAAGPGTGDESRHTCHSRRSTSGGKTGS
jgi:hypothetical protein